MKEIDEGKEKDKKNNKNVVIGISSRHSAGIFLRPQISSRFLSSFVDSKDSYIAMKYFSQLFLAATEEDDDCSSGVYLSRPKHPAISQDYGAAIHESNRARAI